MAVVLVIKGAQFVLEPKLEVMYGEGGDIYGEQRRGGAVAGAGGIVTPGGRIFVGVDGLEAEDRTTFRWP